MQSKHFVLVHGICHGSWCWFKLKPLLESVGHKVTALDMGASGINMKSVETLRTFKDYNEPLLTFMSSLPKAEKVVLVGHSLGGFNLAFAMEEFPDRISFAVFISSFMPDTENKPSYFLEELFTKLSVNGLMDCELSATGNPDEPVTLMSLGPKFLSVLYESSPIPDLELAKMLVRPSPIFIDDLSKVDKLSDGRYGSVRRVYVICKEDKIIPEEFARKMIEFSGLTEVKVLEGVDHMPMLSGLQQLFDCLVQIAVEIS